MMVDVRLIPRLVLKCTPLFLFMSSLDMAAQAADRIPPKAVGTWRAAVLLLEFVDDSSPAYGKAIVDTAFASAKAFYDQASYGQLSITWDVFGPLKIPMNHPCDPTVAYKLVPSAAREAATESAIDLSIYKSIVLAGGGCPQSSLPWDSADIGGPYIYLYGDGSLTPQVLAHELGHNLGLYHANYLNCQAVPYSSGGEGCETIEYGDPIDVMGTRYHDFSAPHKDKLGWIQPVVVDQSGTYEIGPIEIRGSTPRALKIQSPGPDKPVYLEYRQPFGPDIPDADVWSEGLYQGAIMHLGGDPTELLNLNAGTNAGSLPILAGGPSLLPGTTYTDPENRFTIKTLSVSPASMKVQVTIPVSVQTPMLSFGQPLDGQAVSGSVTIAVTAKDPSGIEKVEMYVDEVLLSTQVTGTNGSYLFSWDSTAISGPHQLTARAYANSGSTSGQSVSIRVHPVPVATLVISSSSVVPGATVSLLAHVVVGNGETVSSVKFAITGQSGGTANLSGVSTAPGIYRANWTPSELGTYTIAAVASDADGYSNFSNAAVLFVASTAITNSGVVNAANFLPSVTPGALVSIFGGGFSNTTASAPNSHLPSILGDVSVGFNGLPGALLYVSPSQLNVQVPWDIQAQGVGNGIVHVTVSGPNGNAQADVPFIAAAPAIFRMPNSNRAVAFNSDGSLVAPSGSVPGVDAHPARAGDIIAILGTGFGSVTPIIRIGENSTDTSRTADRPVTVRIAGTPVQVVFAGLSAELVGVDQLKVRVPEGVAGDSVQLIVAGSTTSDPGTRISIAR
jgi:uncharacterized protein (TIGR03437 family)